MAADAFEAMEAKNQKNAFREVDFRHAFSSGRSKVIEAMEAVVKVAEVVEATEAVDLNIKTQEAVHQRIMLQKDVANQILSRAKRATFVITKKLQKVVQIRFFRERSEPRCH